MTALLLGLWLALSGCGNTAPTAVVPTAPADIEDAQCAVCGMFVREQPAPRGQIAWRDGTVEHLCSLGDLRAAAQTPSPHGAAHRVWVEVLPVDFVDGGDVTQPMPWLPAQDAWFVFGASRPLVMGDAVLAFADQASALKHAEPLSTRPVRWAALLSTPFNQVPAQAAGAPDPESKP